MRRLPGTLVLLALIATAAPAATFDYPDVNPPCNTTLQACVNGVPAGSVVQIVTNAPISETVIAAQALTLTAGAGFSPVINGFVQLQGNSASASSSTISNLTVNGTIAALQLGTGAFDAHIVGNTVTNNSSFGIAIQIDSATAPAGTVAYEVRNNTVNVAGSSASDQCHGVLQGGLPAAGTGTTTITDNRVTVTDCGEGSAIEVTPAPGDAVTADILRNYVVATSTNDGILVRNFSSSTATTLSARIVDNVVTGETAQAGLSAAIGVLADGSQPISVQVINNTVAYNEVGIAVSARTDLGADVSGVVANNIAAHNHGGFGTGIGIEPGVALTNDHNLVFDNDSNGFTPGPGTVTADPLFVSTTDFHLLAGSPASNAGNNAEVPPDVTTDLDGNPRIRNGVVDIGAYEMGFASVVKGAAIPAVSPAALLLLAGLLAAGGWLASRRA